MSFGEMTMPPKTEKQRRRAGIKPSKTRPFGTAKQKDLRDFAKKRKK